MNWTKREKCSVEQLPVRIREAIGHASMCWNPVPSTEVFDSTQAGQVADLLEADVSDCVTAERFKARFVMFCAGALTGIGIYGVMASLLHR